MLFRSVGFGGGPAVNAGKEGADQALGIMRGVFRDYFDGFFVSRLDPLPSTATGLAGVAGRHGVDRDALKRPVERRDDEAVTDVRREVAGRSRRRHEDEGCDPMLEERGDPTVESTKARLWRGPAIQNQFTGVAPVRIPLGAGTRIIWVLAGGNIRPDMLDTVAALVATRWFVTASWKLSCLNC